MGAQSPGSAGVTSIDDIALVRLTLQRELETINAYEQYARQASSEQVRAFLRHLAAEEKEHVAEATALMRRLDAEQDALFRTEGGAQHYATGTHTHVGGGGGGAAAPGGPASASAASEAAPVPPAAFTVGSLHRVGAR